MSKTYLTYRQLKVYGRTVRLLQDFCPELYYRISIDDAGGFFIELWMKNNDDK